MTSFGYDSLGRLTRYAQPGDRTINFAYDSGGRMSSLTPPGKPPHFFGYTSDNRLDSYMAPTIAGVPYITRYEYNLIRQLRKTTRPDGSTIEMSYDTMGRTSAISYAGGLTTFGYNSTTGLIETAARGDRVLTLSFDGRMPTATTWSGPIRGTVSRTFDANLRTASVGVNESMISQTYYADGLIDSAGSMVYTYRTADPLPATATQNGIVGTWSYTDRGEVSRYAVVGSDTLSARPMRTIPSAGSRVRQAVFLARNRWSMSTTIRLVGWPTFDETESPTRPTRMTTMVTASGEPLEAAA